MTAKGLEGNLGADGRVLNLECGYDCNSIHFQKILKCTLTIGEFYGKYVIPQKKL